MSHSQLTQADVDVLMHILKRTPLYSALLAMIEGDERDASIMQFYTQHQVVQSRRSYLVMRNSLVLSLAGS